MILTTVLLLLLQSAQAETTAYDEVFMPTYVYIDASDPVREYMSQAERYVSNEEVWFSGTTEDGNAWIVKTTAQGSILEQYVLAFESCERITVLGMNQSENGVLVGARDSKTLSGWVGLLTDDGDITYTPLGEADLFACVPANGGLLALGTILMKDDQTLCAPHVVFVDQRGEIVFEKTGNFGAVEEDIAPLSASCGCASDDAIYIVEARGIPSSILATRELICMDFAGLEKWRVSLQSDVVPYAVSADEDHIYLYGASILWDQAGRIMQKKGLVQCYASEGLCLWTQTFETPDTFLRGTAKAGVCAVAGRDSEAWYISVIQADGTILNNTKIAGVEHNFHKLYILSEDTLRLLGEGKEHLIICDVSF